MSEVTPFENKSQDLLNAADLLYQAAKLIIPHEFVYGQSVIQDADLLIRLVESQVEGGTQPQLDELDSMRNEVNSFIKAAQKGSTES